MQKRANRQVVRKDAEPANDDTVTELTNINVKEVSMVDRAANMRSFLVTKKGNPGRSMRAATETNSKGDDVNNKETPPAAVTKEETPPTPAAPVVAETPVAKEEPAAVVVETPPALAAAAPVVETPVAKDVTTVAVTAIDDGAAISISTDPTPPATAAPPELIAKVKTAYLAGIDAIAARLQIFRAAVEAETPTSASGTSYILWDHTYYIGNMLDALYDIGGPYWEIENAVDAVEKAALIAKASDHKAITTMRANKLAAIHKAFTMCTKDLGDVVGEVTPKPAEDTSTSFAKSDDAPAPAPAVVETPAPAAVVAAPAPAAVVAAPAPAPAPAVDPVAELKKSFDDVLASNKKASEEAAAALKKSDEQIAALRATVAEQGATIAKARGSIQESNASPEIPVAKTGPDQDMIGWPMDLAKVEKSSKGRRF